MVFLPYLLVEVIQMRSMVLFSDNDDNNDNLSTLMIMRAMIIRRK